MIRSTIPHMSFSNNIQMVRNWAKVYFISLTIWVCLAFLLGSQTYINSAGYTNRPSFIFAVQIVLLRYLSYSILTVPLFFIVRRWPINLGRPALRIAFYGSGFALFTVFFAFVRWTIWPAWDPVHSVWLPRTF